MVRISLLRQVCLDSSHLSQTFAPSNRLDCLARSLTAPSGKTIASASLPGTISCRTVLTGQPLSLSVSAQANSLRQAEEVDDGTVEAKTDRIPRQLWPAGRSC